MAQFSKVINGDSDEILEGMKDELEEKMMPESNPIPDDVESALELKEEMIVQETESNLVDKGDGFEEETESDLEENQGDNPVENNPDVPFRKGDIYIDVDNIPLFVIEEIGTVLIGNMNYKTIRFNELQSGRKMSMSVDSFQRFMKVNGCHRFVDGWVTASDYLGTVVIEDGLIYHSDGKEYLQTVESGYLFEDMYEGDPFRELVKLRKVFLFTEDGNVVERYLREEYLKRILLRFSDQFLNVRNEFGIRG